MLLEQKTAIVYGAGGPVGSAVAEAFAAEGARVHLAGRTRARLEPVADRITGSRPVEKAVSAHFTIATTVARHLAEGGGGVILCMAGGREAIPRLGGSHVAWAALAGLCRQLAADLGPHGIRVAWLLSPGSVDSADEGADEPTDGLLPRHNPTFAEVGRVAAFLSSDWASTITAAEINVTGGAVID
jgi:3-oxoacyl-[acyl-carrier protein] reductase